MLLFPIFIFFYCICEYKGFKKIGLMVENLALRRQIFYRVVVVFFQRQWSRGVLQILCSLKATQLTQPTVIKTTTTEFVNEHSNIWPVWLNG